MKKERKQYFASFYDKDNPDDQVFGEAAAKMVEELRAQKNKKRSFQILSTKMIGGEIFYRGQKHEVWLSLLEVIDAFRWSKPPYSTLAGYIKRRLLNL